jgi:HPt (histidine-containing phosphotransfer) domain-containing protein
MSSSGIPASALDAIWARHHDVVLARLDAIDSGTRPDATVEMRTAAAGAAHQLAGTVGTFGFTQGTELAQQIEEGLRASNAGQARLPALAKLLRRELERGPAA